MPNLHNLFNPRSIAVVGVSADPQKLGSIILRNIIDAGFGGPIYPINPKYDKVQGLACYPDLKSIKGDIDVVVIAIRAEFVLDVVKAAAKKNVKNLVIITAGFREIGEKGAVMEAQIRNLAAQHGIRVLGPNCLGYSVTNSKVNATFAAMQPRPGKIAFLSQSGAINSALLDLADERNLGFSHFVSMGNKMDLNELEFLEYWLQDPEVSVIGMYIEQFSDGKDFLDIIHKYPRKPIVILHPGETEASQKAMNLHTGALAGSSAVIRSGLAQAGVVQVDSFEKLFNAMWLLDNSAKPTTNEVTILTNAGGPGVMLTDMLVNAGMQIQQLTSDTKLALHKILPDNANVGNPIDLIGDALADRYERALQILVADPTVNTIMVVVTPQLVTQIEDTANVIIQHSRNSGKLIIPLFIGGSYIESAITRFDMAGVPAFSYPEQAVNALAAVTKYAKFVPHKQLNIKVKQRHNPLHVAEVDKFTTAQQRVLPQQLVEKLAAEVGITLPKQKTITEFDQALGFAAHTNFPLVMKASAEDILHKTDIKAVFTNLHNVQELHDAYSELTHTIKSTSGKSNPHILIQEQVKGEEFIIGANRDGGADVYAESGRGFGHLLVFGKGGIYTEVYADIATGLVPMSKADIHDLINRTKVAKIISGIRNTPKLKLEALVETIMAIQNLVQKYPQIVSLDINPAMLTTRECKVVDLKIIVQK